MVGSEEVPTVNLRDRAAALIETGMHPNSVAMYGTSTESVVQILRSGKIQPTPSLDSPPYRSILTEGGKKNLYYALINGPKIKELNPALYEKLLESSGEDRELGEDIIEDIDETKAAARDYARMQAIEDYFRKYTGATVPHGRLEEIARTFGSLGRDEASKIIAPETLDVLSSAMKRKGVLIYFDKKIFDLAKVEPGIEDERELTIVSDNQLDASVISGIEPLSEEEREEILNI